MMTVTPLTGPVASLKVQRTVPGSADIFTFTKLGDVDGIRTLFEKGLASPHDVQFDSGITPLHVGISSQQPFTSHSIIDGHQSSAHSSLQIPGSSKCGSFPQRLLAVVSPSSTDLEPKLIETAPPQTVLGQRSYREVSRQRLNVLFEVSSRKPNA